MRIASWIASLLAFAVGSIASGSPPAAAQGIRPPFDASSALYQASSVGNTASVPGTCVVKAAEPLFSLSTGITWTLETHRDAGFCGLTIESLGNLAITRLSLDPKPGEGAVQERAIAPRYFIEYRPTPGFTGNDHFAFRLSPADGYFRVAVTVLP